MATREQGLRRTAVVTAGIAAAAVLGSVGVGIAAYAQDQATTTVDGSTPDSTSSAYPTVNDASNSVTTDAHSGGS